MDGTVEIKVHSTITLETIQTWESDFLTQNPSLELISINSFHRNSQQYITVLLSVWDRRWSNSNYDDEADSKIITYYTLNSCSNQFHKVAQLEHSETKKHKVYLHQTTFYTITLNR